MSTFDVLHPDGNDFDPFLFASVGEDRNGATVTVISALARLGLDPWKEAGDLAVLERNAACARLGSHFVEFEDVPALRHEHEAVAQKLVEFLPDRSPIGVAKQAGLGSFQVLSPISVKWLLFALFVVLGLIRFYFLVQSV